MEREHENGPGNVAFYEAVKELPEACNSRENSVALLLI